MAVIQIYVGDEIKAAIEQAAAREKRSVSFLLREWIEAKLERPPQVKPQVKTEESQTPK
jgi:hypothetical protein